MSANQNKKLEGLINEYEDVFTGLGKLPSPVTLHIKPNAIPVQQPPRRMPAALVEPLMERLREMEKANIIEKVDHPTDWVSNIVPTLNKALE